LLMRNASSRRPPIASATSRLGAPLTVHLGGIDQRAAEVQTQLMRCDLLRA
jgi:hypothetical protein